MTKVPPAGRAAAGETGWPLQSTAPPIVAAAPLKMGAKKGSAGIASVQVVMNLNEVRSEAVALRVRSPGGGGSEGQ